MKELTEKELGQKALKERYIALQGEHENNNQSFKLSRQINTILSDAREQGFHDMGKLNKMMAQTIANRALVTKDKEFLDFIYEIKTQGNSNYGKTTAGQNLITGVGAQIDTDLEQDEDRAWTESQRAKARQLEAFNIEIGQLRKDRGNEDYSKNLGDIIQRMNAAGFINQTEAILTFEDQVKKRERIDETITLGDPRAKKYLTIFQEDGKQAMLTALIEDGISMDSQVISVITSSDEALDDLTTNKYYTSSLSIFEERLRNFANKKLQGLLAEMQSVMTPEQIKKPEAFFVKLQEIMLNVQERLKNQYYGIALMKNGRRSFDNFNSDQQQAFFNMLRPDYNSKEEDSLGFILRQGGEDLEEIMRTHLHTTPLAGDLSIEQQETLKETQTVYKILHGTDAPTGAVNLPIPEILLMQYDKLVKELEATGTIADYVAGALDFENPLIDYVEKKVTGLSFNTYKDLDDDEQDMVDLVLEKLEDRIIKLQPGGTR